MYGDKRILIVDDDVTLLKLLQLTLEDVGYTISVASEGEEGLRIAYTEHPDLVVLDVMMPILNGWEVCRRLRQMSDIPIIMLTARNSETDIVRGLGLGADDYLPKPFGVNELLARIEALLRRAETDASLPPHAVYDDGTLKIDFPRQQVWRRGVLVELSRREYDLLACLAKSPGQIMAHQELLTRVWGAKCSDENRYLSLYIRYLRQKLEADPSNPRYILTRWGRGYLFNPPEQASEE